MPATLTSVPLNVDQVQNPAAVLSLKAERPQEPRVQEAPRVQNRVAILLMHIPRFSIQGQAKLAARAGVSRSTISRLIRGRINPSYRLARAVTDALERQLGYPLDMRDVFTTDGTYPTPSGCALCQCHGCLPEHAYDTEACLLPEWRGALPGDWSLARPLSPTPSIHEERPITTAHPAGKEDR